MNYFKRICRIAALQWRIENRRLEKKEEVMQKEVDMLESLASLKQHEKTAAMLNDLKLSGDS